MELTRQAMNFSLRPPVFVSRTSAQTIETLSKQISMGFLVVLSLGGFHFRFKI